MRLRKRRRVASVSGKLRRALCVSALGLTAFVILMLLGNGRFWNRGDLPASRVVQSAETTPSPEPSSVADGEETPEVIDAAEEIADEAVDLKADLANQPAKPENAARTAVIRSFGDIIIHESIYNTARRKNGNFNFAPFFEQIQGSLSGADYTVGNVEGSLGGQGNRGYTFYPQFNTPPHLLTALTGSGVDMLTLANNHALDMYFDGLKRTLDNADKAGLDHVGAYRTKAEYDTPRVVTIGGIKVGFTNYTTSTNNLEKSSDPKASKFGVRTIKNSSPQKDIEALRGAGAEIVVVYMHWGVEYEQEADASQKELAQKLAQAGADVVIGGHPHVVQGIEWVTAQDSAGNERRTLVVYSLGNFLSDQRDRYRDSGIIFEFTLVDDGSGKVEVILPEYVPVYVWRTKTAKGYDYRIIACGDAIASRPETMDDETFRRVKQVWNEQKRIIGSSASIAQN